MKIVVFGAGAVGSFYGGLLARAGQDVRFVARGAQLDALRDRGLRISSPLVGEVVVPPPVSATSHASEIGAADLVLVCVKAHQTADILDAMGPLVAEHTLLMALQNGVESDAVLASRFGAERVLSAVVYVSAVLEQPGLVRHVAAGTLVIGERNGSITDRLQGLQRMLASIGVPVHVTRDIERQRWHKLTFNATFNAVSALTLRTSQDLLAVPETRALLIAAMREVVAVSNARGITLSDADIDQIVTATEQAASVRTSMMLDRERGRLLEVDPIVGVVVRKGKESGVPTPTAAVLYALLTAIDSRGQSVERTGS